MSSMTAEQLYRDYSPLIRRRIFFLTHDPEQADDLTQETFLKALRALPDLKPSDNLRAWCYTIALNTVRDAMRHQKRLTWFSLDADEDRKRLEVASTDPQDEYAAHDHIQQTLAQLPDLYRRALIGYHLENYSINELAARENVSPSAIKTRLMRAREMFRHYYQSQEQL
jgi:RNA polymerase sigma-70 factor, ECF subfamily